MKIFCHVKSPYPVVVDKGEMDFLYCEAEEKPVLPHVVALKSPDQVVPANALKISQQYYECSMCK